MKEFGKWQEKREVKTIGYLNNSSAYNAGEKNGWRAALEWAIKAGKDGNCGWCYTESVIEDELEKE